MVGAASRAGDADSSRAPCLTSGLQGSVNVHRGALLFVPQWHCISSCLLHFCHTCSLCRVELVVQFPARGSTQVLLCLFPGKLWLWHFLYSVGPHPVSSLRIYFRCVAGIHGGCGWPSRRRWLLQGTMSHLWFAGVCECPPWCSIVCAIVTVHQFFCILHWVIRCTICGEQHDLCPTDLNISRDNLLIKDYLRTKFEACGIKCSRVIGYTMVMEIEIPIDRPTCAARGRDKSLVAHSFSLPIWHLWWSC